MGDVLTFAPRSSVAASPEPTMMAEAEIRTRLGEALQTALDAADHIIAVLDGMVGDMEHENGGAIEPALTTPENHNGSQVVWLRGSSQHREADASENAPSLWDDRSDVPGSADVVSFDMVVGGRR